MGYPRIMLSLFLLIIMCGVWLVGCGEDDPTRPEAEPDPDPTEQVDGLLVLPEGWNGEPTELEVINSHGTFNSGGDGDFNAECFRDDRQLAAVCGPGGRPLLMAWFGADEATIDTRTTAEVLLWHALGAWMLPAEGRAGLRDAIADLTTELDGVIATLNAALVENPNGLPETNPEVHQALQDLVDALLAEAGVEKGVIIEDQQMQSGIEQAASRCSTKAASTRS